MKTESEGNQSTSDQTSIQLEPITRQCSLITLTLFSQPTEEELSVKRTSIYITQNMIQLKKDDTPPKNTAIQSTPSSMKQEQQSSTTESFSPLIEEADAEVKTSTPSNYAVQ